MVSKSNLSDKFLHKSFTNSRFTLINILILHTLPQPEIFIPLRHLTTTLEVLGNILFMRDDIQEARSSLERACPLMELLPASVNEDHRFAVGCFALLREVYGKLYSIRDGGDRELLGIDGDGNDDNDVYSGAADDDIDLGRDVDKDRGRYDDDEDDGGRRRGRRRRRKRGKLHNYSQSLSPTSSGSQGSGLFDGDRDDNEDFVLHTSLDIDRRFEDLRSPYDHLRAELHLQQLQENHQPAPQIMYREGSGLATATADLDALVQRFVYEDNVGRLKLFRMAKEYHEAMTVHMTANPQLVNGLGRDLDIVLVYVDVLSRVNTEGSFDFISKELDSFNLAATSRGNERALGLEDCSENGDATDDFDEDEDDDDDYDDQEEEENVDRLSKDEDPVSESENDPSDDPDGTEEPPETADILSGRLGGRNSDSSRVKGRSISGAGRIRRHSSVAGSITELLKSQQSLRVPGTGTEKPKQKNGKIASEKSKKSTKSIVLQADSASRSTIQRLFESKAPKGSGSIDNLESATIGGKYRSTPLTPAERNRFLVLNAFERALSDHHNPSLQCSDNDNEKSPGVIYGNGRDGRKREKSGRDRWSYHNYERDRESASKIFESFVDDDKLRVHSESVTSILLTLSTFLVVIILRAIFLTTRTRSKILLEQGTGQCKGRYIKARTYGEYFLSQVPLPVTLVAVIGSILGIQSSRGLSCAVEDAAASSNIDDLSPNNQSKNKKDTKRSGRGDYRERDSHRLLPAISLDISTVKEGEPRGFFSELQSVMISIWKELSSTVASSPTVQIHVVASNPPVKTKGTPAVVTVPQGVIPPTNSCPIILVPTTANPCVVTSPVNKFQQQMKVPSSKKDKALANGKAKVGGHSATDSSVKKVQPNNGVKVKAQVTVPICAPVRTPCPTDDTSSRDSDNDSDADSAVRSGGDILNASKLLVRNLSATPIDPTDDDAGYSRYVRKGSVNAAKSAAAAASSRTVELIVPKPAQLSNSTALTSLAQRNAAALSMAPIVDAATVAQQRAALLYYETLKEKERLRLLSVAKGQQSSPSVPPQQATGTGPAAWSTVSRLSTPPTTSKTNISVPLHSSSSLKSANTAVIGVTPKGSTSSHSFASAIPKSITYASVAQNTSTSASSGLHEHSTRSSLSSIGSSASSHSVRASFTSTVAPSKDATSSNPHSANNSCPSSPGGSLSKRRGGGVGKDNSSSKASKNAKGCGSDLSPAQIEEHHNAYLRAREQASDQLQQLQLMSDLRSLSVRPAEGITSTAFIPEPFVTEGGYHVQPQTSRSLSSSFDGSRSQIQSQFGGLVGFLTESEKEREAGRERALLATYTSDNIGDMDIGTIDLSFALANDVDGDIEPDKSMTSNIDSLYGSNGSQQHSLMQGQGQDQGGYDYRGLSQYSVHATQDEQLNSENNVHNYYLATGDVDGIAPQSYSQSPYSYGDYKPSAVPTPTEDLDRSIPRPRGFSSGSQLDLTAQSLSGLSPNAPSFNPNTMAAWRGLPAITQPSQVNPFDQSLIQQPPHNIGLMDSELNIDYAANLDYTVQMQLQLQHQHLYFQENTSSMQGYEGRFSQFMSVTHPSQLLQQQQQQQQQRQQQQQHPLSMFYKQEGESSHQSLPVQHNNIAINSCLPNPPGIPSTSTSTFAAVPATFQYTKTSVSETEKSTTPEP